MTAGRGKLRVMVLMHEDLVPPDSLEGLSKEDMQPFVTEWDVVNNLQKSDLEIIKLGASDELTPIRKAIKEHEPHITFNLLEEFAGHGPYDQHVVSYLELMRMPYTGCNPRGLVLSRDKALSKKILAYHRIRVPGFAVFPIGRKVRRPRRLEFPLIVKSLVEDASLGIAKASVVENDAKLAERVEFIHQRIKTDAIAERFIEGRELYVGLIGNERLRVLPVWELLAKNLPDDEPLIATAKLKWDKAYQKRIGVTTTAATGLPDGLEEYAQKVSKRIYRALGLCGYARLDFRLSDEGKLYLLEANPNPDISKEEDFALSAHLAGLRYRKLLRRIIGLGLRRGGQLG